MSNTDTWLTPPHIMKPLGIFDLDPCAAPDPRPWNTAINHYTFPHSDGLKLPWKGRIWLNPPYGPPTVVTPWLRQMAKHGKGTALIFARTETEMFHRYVWEQASALLFLKGRLFFCRRDGIAAKHNAGCPSVLCAYGAYDSLVLKLSGLKGAFVRLKS